MRNSFEHVSRRYFVEFGAAMAAYVAAILVRHWALHDPVHGMNGPISGGRQLAMALLPLLPACFLLAAIVRVVRGTDELFRRIYVDSLALAGGAMALLAITYGLIESDSFPHLSAWWTYVTFMAAWMVAGIFVRRQYR